jgi:hypothetical protein
VVFRADAAFAEPEIYEALKEGHIVSSCWELKNKFRRKSVVWSLLILLIALGSCFRIFICFHFNPVDFLFSDPQRHWLNGSRFPRAGYLGASDPFGYQLFIFVLRKVTFDNRYLVAFVSAALSVLMPWTYYRTARAFGLPKGPSLCVWALIVWAPSLLVVYHYIMMETLLLLLDGLALWATARYLRKGGCSLFLLMVFLWTGAVLTKPTVAPLAGVCGLWSWWKQRPPLKTIAVAAALVIVMLIPQAIRSEVSLSFIAPLGNPWLIRIQQRTNTKSIEIKFYPHPNKYSHFKTQPEYDFLFTSPSSFVKPLAPLSDWQIRRGRDTKLAVISINSAYGQRDWKNAYEAWAPSASVWFDLWGENIVLFLFSPSWPENESHIWIDTWEPPSRWIWAPLTFFVLAGNIGLFLKRRFDLLPVATTCLTLFLALQNVVIFEGRYRKPLEPLLFINMVWIIVMWSMNHLPGRTSPDESAGLRQRESSPTLNTAKGL